MVSGANRNAMLIENRSDIMWMRAVHHEAEHSGLGRRCPYQADTGNLAQAGGNPLDYQKKYGSRYWLYHIKDVPALGADHDTDLGKGVIDFKSLLASIDNIDNKHLYVEQESYPGAPIDSVRRDYAYLSKLTF